MSIYTPHRASQECLRKLTQEVCRTCTNLPRFSSLSLKAGPFLPDISPCLKRSGPFIPLIHPKHTMRALKSLQQVFFFLFAFLFSLSSEPQVEGLGKCRGWSGSPDCGLQVSLWLGVNEPDGAKKVGKGMWNFTQGMLTDKQESVGASKLSIS